MWNFATFKPTARGQARGNSGLYLQRRYELQVLDSFGIEMTSAKNDCGCLHVRSLRCECLFPAAQLADL